MGEWVREGMTIFSSPRRGDNGCSGRKSVKCLSLSFLGFTAANHEVRLVSRVQGLARPSSVPDKRVFRGAVSGDCDNCTSTLITIIPPVVIATVTRGGYPKLTSVYTALTVGTRLPVYTHVTVGTRPQV